MTNEHQKIVFKFKLAELNTPSIMQVEKLVEDGDWKELAAIMAPRLEFGTAGIRGRMGAGFGRMNDLVIIQVSLVQVKIF